MTKSQFLSNLRTQRQNVAVTRHIAKVEAMDDAAFAQHLINLDDMVARASASLDRMAGL